MPGIGDSSAWCNVFFMILWKPWVAGQIPVSHRLPEKSMHPCFWAAESSEMFFPHFTSLRKGYDYDQGCCAVWGSTHHSACGKWLAEPHTLFWESPPFCEPLQSATDLSGFNNWALEVVLMAWISILNVYKDASAGPITWWLINQFNWTLLKCNSLQ